MAILSFKCSETKALFDGKRIRHFVRIEKVAMRKLAILTGQDDSMTCESRQATVWSPSRAIVLDSSVFA